MEYKRIYEANISTGVVVFGNVSISQFTGKYGVAPDTEAFIGKLVLDIQKEIGNTGKLVVPSFGAITNLSLEDSAYRNDVFHLSNPLEERPYTIFYLSDGALLDEMGGSIRLLSEKRKLRLIPVIHIEQVTQVPEVLRDAIFGNIGNFYLGNMSNEDLNFLQQRIK